MGNEEITAWGESENDWRVAWWWLTLLGSILYLVSLYLTQFEGKSIYYYTYDCFDFPLVIFRV